MNLIHSLKHIPPEGGIYMGQITEQIPGYKLTEIIKGHWLLSKEETLTTAAAARKRSDEVREIRVKTQLECVMRLIEEAANRGDVSVIVDSLLKETQTTLKEKGFTIVKLGDSTMLAARHQEPISWRVGW